MTDLVPMTRESYEKKREQLRVMEQEEMPLIEEKIAEARDEGDLKENAEYHGQRENQGMLQAKINQIRSELARAQIIDPSQMPKDEVAFGATVRLLDTDIDEEEEITLVGAGQDDFDAGKYLITGPVGQGLLGRKIGEKVSIKVPRGFLNYEILDIRYE